MSFSGPNHPGAISIVNYKGGVGKTTLTMLLAYYLSREGGGSSVLLVDIDAQCSLSIAARVDPGDLSDASQNIYSLVQPNMWSNIVNIDFPKYRHPVDISTKGNIELIYGSFESDELDLTIAKSMAGDSDQREKELFLYCKQVLNGFSDFDYILIDCPPNRMYLTQAMLRASTGYVAVTIPDKLSTFGMPRLLRWIEQIPEQDRPRMLGYVLNTVNRAGGHEMTNMQWDFSQEVENVIGHPPLGTIPRLNVIPEVIGGDRQFSTLRNSSSGQPSVHQCMESIKNGLLKNLE